MDGNALAHPDRHVARPHQADGGQYDQPNKHGGRCLRFGAILFLGVGRCVGSPSDSAENADAKVEGEAKIRKLK